MLLAGPRGVGKTQLGKALGEELGLPTSIIEMNSYAEGGVEEFRRELARAVRKSAYSVIVLDEIEKASPQVKLALLGVLEDGYLRVAEQLGTGSVSTAATVRLSFQNTTILATTNAGQTLALQHAGAMEGGKRLGFKASVSAAEVAGERTPGPLPEELIRQTLIQDGINDTVVDRFQAIELMFTSTRSDFREIVRFHTQNALKEQAARQGVQLTIQNWDEFLDYAVTHYYHPGVSNRVARDLPQGFVRTVVADLKISGHLQYGGSAAASTFNNQFSQ
jgi:ATP-dependent Clp protease ATP-binding subunit ClpA